MSVSIIKQTYSSLTVHDDCFSLLPKTALTTLHNTDKRHRATKERHTGVKKSVWHPKHLQPKPSPVQSAVGTARQELDSTATNKHARTVHQPSYLVSKELAVIIGTVHTTRWRWLFCTLARIWGECSIIHSPPVLFFFFFEVEICSHALIPLFMPGSVHSGSAN